MNIRQRLDEYSQQYGSLSGIQTGLRGESFLQHLRASAEREAYICDLSARSGVDAEEARRADPFGPYEAAAALTVAGQEEEAIWICFLAAMVGHHRVDQWRRLQNLYQQFDGKRFWSWEQASQDPGGFRTWLLDNLDRLVKSGRRGNHRKFCSPDPRKRNNFADTVASYVAVISQWKTQRAWLDFTVKKADGNPTVAFDLLYQDVSTVANFGRLGTFDFLTRLGHLGLAPIEPGTPYLVGATGPARGADLLFHDVKGKPGVKLQCELNEKATVLAEYLGVSMSVMEDALCCWNDKPDYYFFL